MPAQEHELQAWENWAQVSIAIRVVYVPDEVSIANTKTSILGLK